MEQNKKYRVFEVVCDDESLISKAIELYNVTDKTNLQLVEYILDEVNFAKISGEVKLSDIFQLGALYGRLSREKQE